MKWLGEPVNRLSGQICGQRLLCGNHWISIQAGFLIAPQMPESGQLETFPALPSMSVVGGRADVNFGQLDFRF